MKNIDTIDNVDFEIKWQGQPAGLLGTIASFLHINFTHYQITKDELIVKRGFFSQKTNTTELYLLKDADLTINLWQKLFNVGNVSVIIDSHSTSERAGQKITLKNIKNCEKVRKLLRDSIEADVMERKITYFDKV